MSVLVLLLQQSGVGWEMGSKTNAIEGWSKGGGRGMAKQKTSKGCKVRGGGESGKELLLGNNILQPRLEVPVKIFPGLLLNQFLQI